MQNQNRGFKKYSENNIDNYLFLDYESNLMGYVKNNKLMRIMNITSDEIGNIYRARVKNIDRDLNAAFVDLGDNGIGFLQLDKDSSVNESDILILQVIKMPDNKGLKLTLEVAIPDKYFVIFPFDKFVKFSKKLDSGFRKRNEEKLLNISEEEGVGILLRTETKDLTEEEFILKLNSAVSRAEKIKNEENKLPVPKLLYEK
ncbi:ribonuclease E/G, partial [Peptoniphilus sp.]|uniref:ribonuclease E/G n=1 Tax=Peptoniphilus sp. TaxID=1971214 RepID=UPI003D8C07F2